MKRHSVPPNIFVVPILDHQKDKKPKKTSKVLPEWVARSKYYPNATAPSPKTDTVDDIDVGLKAFCCGFKKDFSIDSYKQLVKLAKIASTIYPDMESTKKAVCQIAHSLYFTQLGNRFDYETFIDGVCNRMPLPRQMFDEIWIEQLRNNYPHLLKFVFKHKDRLESI